MGEVGSDVADLFLFCVHDQGFGAAGSVGDGLKKGIVGRKVIFPAGLSTS